MSDTYTVAAVLSVGVSTLVLVPCRAIGIADQVNDARTEYTLLGERFEFWGGAVLGPLSEVHAQRLNTRCQYSVRLFRMTAHARCS